MAYKAAKNIVSVFIGGHVCLGGYAIYSGNEKFYKNAIMPCIRILDCESAHRLAVISAKYGFMPKIKDEHFTSLKTKVWGLDFDNPVGIAAGFDKDGEAIESLFKLGFGFVEIGSVTPYPQSGNPKPRVFRLSEDKSVINRYGFNSEGHEAVKKRLEKWRCPSDITKHNILGVNLGKNKESLDAIKDYTDGIHSFGGLCDYLVINISSPNTPGLRSLQKKEKLHDLIVHALKERTKLDIVPLPPLLIKIAPDLSDDDMVDLASVICSDESKVDGLIVCNTTISRPESLKSKYKGELGGLSGASINHMSTQIISRMYQLTGGQIPIVGVGGISSGPDVIEKIKAGASLVQLYSAIIYEGPLLISRIKRDLNSILEKEGISNVSSLIGLDHRNTSEK